MAIPLRLAPHSPAFFEERLLQSLPLLGLKFFDGVLAVSQVFSRLPCVRIMGIALPFDEIVHLRCCGVDTGTGDTLDFPLILSGLACLAYAGTPFASMLESFECLRRNYLKVSLGSRLRNTSS